MCQIMHNSKQSSTTLNLTFTLCRQQQEEKQANNVIMDNIRNACIGMNIHSFSLKCLKKEPSLCQYFLDGDQNQSWPVFWCNTCIYNPIINLI